MDLGVKKIFTNQIFYSALTENNELKVTILKYKSLDAISRRLWWPDTVESIHVKINSFINQFLLKFST